LGDNPFFGIDHLSQDIARERQKRLDGMQKITDIMEYVSECGVKDFVVSTHPQLRELIENMKGRGLEKKFDFYPIIPYAQGYVSKITEKGLINGLNETLSHGSTQNKLRILFSGIFGYVTKDFRKMLKTLIDIELLPLSDVKIKMVLLHNVLVDLAIGLEMKDVLNDFVNHIKDKHNVQTGFVTNNFPTLLEKFEKWGLELPTIMTSFNSVGFQMNPSKEDCEKKLGKCKVIAMNILAGGFSNPYDSMKYLADLKINSMVVGMSTKKHSDEIITLFNKMIGKH